MSRIYAENLEHFLLGDINCNLLPGKEDAYVPRFLDILNTYGHTQLTGVFQLGKSDHPLVFMTRKLRSLKTWRHTTIVARQWKFFDEEKFLSELKQKPWSNVFTCEDPNEMWLLWKQFLMTTIATNMHLLKPGGCVTKILLGSLVNLYVKCTRGIFLKRNLVCPLTILYYGNNINRPGMRSTYQ